MNIEKERFDFWIETLAITCGKLNTVSNQIHNFDLSKPINICYHNLNDLRMEMLSLKKKQEFFNETS